ncbi:MAG: endonuclease/exonuclease/phosphatase family protein [Nitrospinae bacterium]|nr:endonuclease/exonuclease/phosphatase family protein [Nitrospinota bacterium]
MSRLLSIGLGFMLAVSFGFEASAEKLSIATWNLEGPAGLQNRDSDIRRLGEFVQNVDFLILQEALGKSQVKNFLEAAGHSQWHHAVSDFADDAISNPYHKLEVSVVSPHAITRVYEADPYAKDDSAEAKSHDHDVKVPDYIPSGQRKMRIYRGWLWVEFGSLKIAVVAVHLKSSGGRTGKKDEQNSFKREAIVAALIETIKAHARKHEDWSYVVAGDFNVAPGDINKIGTNLNLRCLQPRCNGYDQTHALFGAGLVDGFAMRNLVLGLGTSYAKGNYAKSPIDNIYVMGPRFDKTTTVVSERGETFGSDHYAIRVMVLDE